MADNNIKGYMKAGIATRNKKKRMTRLIKMISILYLKKWEKRVAFINQNQYKEWSLQAVTFFYIIR